MAKQKRSKGRPPLYETPEQMQEKVDAYFEVEDEPTISGLAVFLGMTRAALWEYEKYPDFFDVVKRAKGRVESAYEKRLVYSNAQATGTIFALKQIGWTDKHEIETPALDAGINEIANAIRDIYDDA